MTARAIRPSRPRESAHDRARTRGAPVRDAPQDLTRIRFVSDPQISPDGRAWPSWSRPSPRSATSTSRTSGSSTSAGGEPRRFTAGPRRDTAPRWSPDGTRLAFLSERERKNKGQLYVMPADGGRAGPAHRAQPRRGEPRLVAGRHAAGLRLRVGGRQEPESEEESEKSRPARVITTLKSVQRRGLRLRPAARTSSWSRRTAAAPRAAHRRRLRRADPAWSPDGRRRRLRLRPPRRARRRRRERHLVVAAEGGTPRRLTRHRGPRACRPSRRTAGPSPTSGRRRANGFGRNTGVSRSRPAAAPPVPHRRRSTVPAAAAGACGPHLVPGRRARSPSPWRTRATSAL